MKLIFSLNFLLISRHLQCIQWIATLLGLTIAGASHAQIHSFKDWAIACDNTRHCEALGYQNEETGSAPVVLWMSRDAGPNTAVTIKLDTDEGDKPFSLHVGNTTIRSVTRDQALTESQTRQMLSQMLRSEEVVITEGAKRWHLSLAGSNAALLKMDDIQGRVGTPGALVRTGKKAESTVPVAPPIPVVRTVDIPQSNVVEDALLKSILKSIKLRDCWEDLPDESGPHASITRMSNTQVLVVRECGRGAYQSGYGLWLANSKEPFSAKRLNLPLPFGKATDYVMNASLDASRLFSYTRGRGIGDCGESESWAWDGNEFVLIEASLAPLCRGFPDGGYSLRTWKTQASARR